MEIKRSGAQPSGKGPADWFTGADTRLPLDWREQRTVLGFA
jgi:hypothetical protein